MPYRALSRARPGAQASGLMRAMEGNGREADPQTAGDCLTPPNINERS